MNERLKELYTQVCMEQKLPFTLEHNSAVMLDAFADKFAELIVKEDMDVVAKKCASPTAYNALAEHWGIEE
jgi:hypothetical protein